MSSRKVSTTITIAEELFLKVKADAKRELRSMTSMVEKILLEHYEKTQDHAN